MQDDKNLVVHICPTATSSEFIPTDADTTDDNTKNQALLGLANTRAVNFKRAIVEQGMIDSARLLLCAPALDTSAKGLPRISIQSQ